MKGDFSWLDHRPLDNYTGVLEQQGRVRLDRDGNAAEEIARSLRSLMGRDAFGPGRVAVPSEAAGSLKVTAAETDGATVRVTLNPGRAWIDGIPLILGAEATETATYLPPPFQPATDPSSIAAGTRDLVVLEVWEDSLNGFQEPDRLIEPALGGVDTTERVKAFHRLRLLRLAEDEDCSNVGPRLRDDPATIGRLTVTPAPSLGILGDCPVEAGGGYSGDGHRFYCIEIAPPAAAGPRFTASRFGGGLVGRGMFDPVANRVTVTANAPMINASDLGSFHLQALAPDDAGAWAVVFEATATLVEDGILSIAAATGAWPAPAGQTAFFRLWDSIHDVSAFTAATELADGIRLAFTAPTADGSNYRPGDRWLFPVRAAGTGFDPALWPQNALPDAIRYHRAPLAILNWTAAPPVEIGPAAIDDCRDSFPPLTDPCPCCTITVGDGVSTHGDEDSIEAAIARLPSTGGKICLLPGTHTTNAVIRERANITILGCGRNTRVIPRPGNREAPVFTVIDSEAITLERMEIISLSGTGIRAFETEDGLLRQLAVLSNRILAAIRAIEVEGGTETLIRDNRLRMLDRTGAGVAIFLTGEDSRIERNDLGVVPAASTPRPPEGGDDPRDEPEDPNDPCADPETVYANPGFLIGFTQFLFGFVITAILPPPYRALGGIQIGAGSERIAVLDNRILGGAGNGITLGGGLTTEAPGPDVPDFVDLPASAPILGTRGTATGPDNAPAAGVTLRLTAPSGAVRTAVTSTTGAFSWDGTGEAGTHRVSSDDPTLGVASATVTDRINLGAGQILILAVTLARIQEQPDPTFAFVYAVRIESNEITAMGLNGIGVPPPAGVLPERPAPAPTLKASAVAANPLLAALGTPLVDIIIIGNRITGCLATPFTAAMTALAARFGLGGISLGVCDTLTIAGNRIEGNGRRHLDPVCGIFVLLGEQVEITDNLVRDNGPIVLVQGDIIPGQRSGIAGIFLSVDLGAPGFPVAGKPALRLHDNVVEQPMGRAVTALAAGPVSIQANFLAAELTPPEPLARMAGAVMLLSFSGVGRLPGGGCLVNDNQIRLGFASTAFGATLLAAASDIGFDANQCDALQAGLTVGSLTLMFNTLVIAATARATGNRLTERILPGDSNFQVSLLTSTNGMNTTTTNQADHCIFAADRATPARLVSAGNLVLDNARCQNLTGAENAVAVRPVFGMHALAGTAFRDAPPPTAPEGLGYFRALDSASLDLDGMAQARLADAANIKATSRALIANEIARLEAKGTTRPDLIAANQVRLERATALTDRLATAAQVVADKPTPPKEGLVAVQGRVLDADGRGVAGREVALADARGRPIAALDPATSDTRGGYAFSFDKARLEEIAAQIKPGVTVTSGKARSDVFRIADALTLAPDLVLTDIRTAGDPGPRPTADPPLQRLARPELTAAARPRRASGRVGALIAQALRPANKDEG